MTTGQSDSSPGARRAVWALVVALAVLHWDFWFWDSSTLVLGFLPIGLAYHALFSIACAVTWYLVSRFAWPEHLERWADAGEFGARDSDRETRP